MKLKIYYLIAFLIVINSSSIPQSSNFNLDKYKQFLKSNQNLNYSELLSLYNIGTFNGNINGLSKPTLYLDTLEKKIGLTKDEKDLLNKNGFVVTERVSEIDFRYMFMKIWENDLPVFITTDAILHALHRSYDNILKYVEVNYLIPKLNLFLDRLHSTIPLLENKYSTNPLIKKSIEDIDFYLTVPRKLLNETSQPIYQSNIAEVNIFLNYILTASYIETPFLSRIKRKIDFSQFVPRGHYLDGRFPQLIKYFKTMIWLGRMELYLFPPVSEDPQLYFEDIQRQIIDSQLIMELVEASKSWEIYYEIEKTISSFVGEQDNVTLDQLKSTFEENEIYSALDLIEKSSIESFQLSLAKKPFADQKILSQVLSNNPFNPDQIKPASSFLILGQRFVIDSYITSNVVFDRIFYNNRRFERILPSSLDILFALGNSASIQLLGDELEKYKYSSNLASLRYLIDSYGENFWNFSIYNSWLNSIRKLSPPQDRSKLPNFMQTGAWWQQKMNTQLASWTELRHDNILYAKQSYTGFITCSYPHAYVEPIPEFYNLLKEFSFNFQKKLTLLPIDLNRAIEYWKFFGNVMDTLHSVSVKELTGIEFTLAEKSFLKKVLYKIDGCGKNVTGWYPKLLFDVPGLLEFGDKRDYIVADFHTAPSDEYGALVGYVKHSGTGPINLMIVTTELPGVGMVAFAGPVYSYYEYTTLNFKRLNDDEWKSTYLSKANRPDWVNVYLTDVNGYSLGEGGKLITGIENRSNYEIPLELITVTNYPNPFNPETTIHFNIPINYSNSLVELSIYDIQGRVIKKLLKESLPTGSYYIKWNGKNDNGLLASSGIYFYSLRIGQKVINGKMNLVK